MHLTAPQAAAALRWLTDSGVDVLVGDRPGNWLTKPSPLLKTRVEPARAPAQTSAPPPSLGTASTAPIAAGRTSAPPLTARTLEELRAEAEAYPLSIRRPGRPFVFADGNPGADLMVIGEAPGAQEEREGKPFVGPAGQLLDRMLSAIDLDRSKVYIANLSPWRPAQNRTPSMQEAAECLPLLHRHIAIAGPKLILTVGGTSAKALLQTETGIMRLRGKWRDVEIEGQTYAVLPTFHPAFLLRQPEQKRLAWLDLLAFRARAAQG
ncbi:uracil-DNA glycosylase [Pacificimonas sp. WHA3]|uniref:uracil-DNA glycosylase n=1 Tax=Pacificimonas pallii TaxID=2827236 RepID=A0ABS6SDH2_9SPHN|nr:uracil-DNA glycosylase [Pacificimonas pallii]MBV7256467.1 uracil-DNA glycosylase [Pacificimonas pallii]